MTYYEIHPDDKPIEVTEQSIKRGHAVATGLRSIVVAGEWLKTEGLNLYSAELGSPDREIIFIPSKPVLSKVIGLAPNREGDPLGEPRFSAWRNVDTPRRIARLTINSDSDLNQVILDAKTTQEIADKTHSPSAVVYDTFSFVLDEHTLSGKVD